MASLKMEDESRMLNLNVKIKEEEEDLDQLIFQKYSVVVKEEDGMWACTQPDELDLNCHHGDQRVDVEEDEVEHLKYQHYSVVLKEENEEGKMEYAPPSDCNHGDRSTLESVKVEGESRRIEWRFEVKEEEEDRIYDYYGLVKIEKEETHECPQPGRSPNSISVYGENPSSDHTALSHNAKARAPHADV
ncbi:hypothetical protein UPYG_G00127520 [Umbra pygmaea]|uniref:Uncharacterized protein n=1 Tax=Umbra pygmaea TaxID=75934 RepID=A0ABD0X6E7_UMBPY